MIGYWVANRNVQVDIFNVNVQPIFIFFILEYNWTLVRLKEKKKRGGVDRLLGCLNS